MSVAAVFSKYKRWIRVGILLLCIVFDVFLFRRWIAEQTPTTLVPIRNFLDEVRPGLSETVLGNLVTAQLPESVVLQPDINPESIYAVINTERTARKLSDLDSNPALASAAAKVVAALLNHDLDFSQVDAGKIVTTYLQQQKFTNMSLYHDTLVGPLTVDQLAAYWQGDVQHQDTIASPDFALIGVATGAAEYQGQLQGVIVTVYAKPHKAAQTQPTATARPLVFPPISSTSILEALNVYRATHRVHQLVEHPKLCEYAEKRVTDLLAYGGLDGHAGFRDDFADSENIPAAIKEYPGGAIGENLAYQFCKNMTTGDSFVAQNATALIEWCFDSSTKGHREAQLNPRYNNVCARSSNGYFVIIFGE